MGTQQPLQLQHKRNKMCCVGLEKFYLLGLVFEILAYILQGVYCSRFPWTDRDVEGNIWTELGRERGLYERPHGGMYSSYWWGSRIFTSAILAIFTSAFMILAKILRSQQLISENVKSRTILSWIVNAFSVAGVIFSIASVVLYTSVVRVDSET